MAWLLTSILVAVMQGVSATPDAQITTIAKLVPRQQADPSALGWLSTSGASTCTLHNTTASSNKSRH
jgi:hypothetical protein